MINHTLDVSQHCFDCKEMTFLRFLHEFAQQSNNLTYIYGLVLQRCLKDPMICLYNITFTNSSFVSFLNFAYVSNGVEASLLLLISNLFKISWAYFLWCKNTPPHVSLNSNTKKYDNFPKSGISNLCISFNLIVVLSVSYASAINKSSTYSHKMIWLALLASFTYTPCFETHFVKHVSIRKLSILLF